MKLFFDFFPVILFFIAYKMYDIYVATAVIMAAMTCQVLGVWFVKKKVEKVYLFSWAAILVLGGLTLILRNPEFVKWKPTIVNWVLALVFLGSQYIGEKNLVRRMLGPHFEMPDRVWARTNFAWVAFFFVCGVLNLAVAEYCSENAWVNFKLFGLTALSFVFMFGLIFSLRGYLADVPEEEPSEDQKPAEPAGQSVPSEGKF